MHGLTGRVAVATGTAGGIGLGPARPLTPAARVVAATRREKPRKAATQPSAG